jgi:cyclopropane fatty-acyl-phospholipid synthase-like methyltransferase
VAVLTICKQLGWLIVSEGSTNDRLELAARLVGYANGTRYRVRGDFLFQGIRLIGMHVLEVGCGNGAWAIWAALHGADRVVGIEPQAAGSTENTLTEFRQTIETLKLSDKVVASNQYLHELPVEERPFDVIVMYNVINHLDEEAVVVLSSEVFAYERYVTLLKDLRLRMRSGGWAVVADCARTNFWLRLGLRSPFAPTIEWHKHQNPRTWIKVFKSAGFKSYDVRWSPLQPLPKLTANWLVQYLTMSNFVLRFRAV